MNSVQTLDGLSETEMHYVADFVSGQELFTWSSRGASDAVESLLRIAEICDEEVLRSPVGIFHSLREKPGHLYIRGNSVMGVQLLKHVSIRLQI